ncbi:ribose 5-phosphate isomerase B [Dehalogenimonas lykanthroporepellens BL-DC-9]|nr:ribose 5-phosphate isomerase B [Dehalogenimonas lykanthroporepellens BL-DC-9]
MKIAIGNDHRGYELKKKIITWLAHNGYEVTDYGTSVSESVDYPDYAHSVADAVSSKKADRGILICGTGIGMSITANKHQGIRAALCYKPEYALLTRKHNDANLLCLGELNGDDLNLDVVRVFFETEFEGGRHLPRIKKIEA